MPIREGREFTAADRRGAPAVAIVNEAFARKLPGQPRDRTADRSGGSRGPASITIVGVAAAAASPCAKRRPFWYVPYTQLGTVGSSPPRADGRGPGGDAREPDAGDRFVRQRRHRLPRTDDDASDRGQVVAERLLATLATGFGLISALLASIGLYGVLSFVTWSRTREIGLRMALGASRRSILGLIVRQTSVLILAGLAAGMILAVTLARQVQSLLFGIEAVDAPPSRGTPSYRDRARDAAPRAARRGSIR
jgi:hypothetical protein